MFTSKQHSICRTRREFSIIKFTEEGRIQRRLFLSGH